MKSIILASLVLFGLLVPSADAQDLHPAPPSFAEKAICQPHFQVDGQTLVAGTAFVLETNGINPRRLLVTADHLFGPDGGLQIQIPWDELAKRVAGVECIPFSGGQGWRAGAALTIPGAHPIKPLPLQDISAFVLQSPLGTPKIVALKLAERSPKLGESVWLVARVFRGAPPEQLLHHAVITHVGEDLLQYSFDNPLLNLQATSGAPVVNVNGDVVGINIAGGLINGKFEAAGDSLNIIRRSIETAR